MRSIAFTLVLIAAAALLGGAVAWRSAKGGLGTLFGTPPATPGARLYEFKPADAVRIHVKKGATEAEFVRTSDGWRSNYPWRDRMDPLAAAQIVAFTLNLIVQDSCPASEVPAAETGLADDQAVILRIDDAAGHALARYRIGKRSPWIVVRPDGSERDPTVYIQPTDSARKSTVYICTGDIRPLFRNNLAFLRDHHPFRIPHPSMVREIQIRDKTGDMTLARAKPDAPWRITKPLELATDPTAVSTFVRNLANLAAVSVTDEGVPVAAAGSQPAASGARDASGTRISVSTFVSPDPEILTVRPPASPADADTYGTVSDRPGVLFRLPLKPEPNLVSLADLAVTVNSLRDPALVRLNIPAIETIVIRPSTGKPIAITRKGEKLWTTVVDGAETRVNEVRLYELLKSMENRRATGFESDAATDFTQWGLEPPALTLSFIPRQGDPVVLRFGLGKHGNLFANRVGSPTVVRMDPDLLESIAANAYEWRHARVDTPTRNDITRIIRTAGTNPPVTLSWSFFSEHWSATGANGADLTASLDPARATYLLGGIENIEASRWLPHNDPGAIAALAKPAVSLDITYTRNELGEDLGEGHRTLTLAPKPGSSDWYGRLEGEHYLFLIPPDLAERLTLDPMTAK